MMTVGAATPDHLRAALVLLAAAAVDAVALTVVAQTDRGGTAIDAETTAAMEGAIGAVVVATIAPVNQVTRTCQCRTLQTVILTHCSVTRRILSRVVAVRAMSARTRRRPSSRPLKQS